MNNKEILHLKKYKNKTEIICFSLFFITPFLFSWNELDRFYSSGWLYFALITVLYYLINFNKHKNVLRFLALFSLLIFQTILNQFDLDNLGIYVLLLYGITIGVKFELNDEKIAIYMGKILLFIWIILLIITILSLIKLFKLGYSHENTYNSIIYFSHRNILTEYMTVYTFFLTQFLKYNKNKALIFQLISFTISMILQSKAAILGNLISFIVIEKKVIYVYILIIFSLLIYNLKNFKSFYNDKWEYFENQKKFGFFEKNLDLIYITCYSGSSYDRRNTWLWTIQNINFKGHGIGTWKYNFMGKISLREASPDVLHRRPHNDILLILYELGFLGIIILTLFIKKILNSRFYVIIPILLIAFPLERAEFLMIITMAVSNLKQHEN